MWEQVVRIALKAKNKLAFINGKIAKLVNKDIVYSTEANAWKMMNFMITSWIMIVKDPKLHRSVAYVDSAKKMWENIQKRYSIPNVPKIHQLKAAIAISKQEEQEVVDFFNKLMRLWNNLDNYVKWPTCTCGAAEEIAKAVERHKIHQFLFGLDDELFSTV